MKKINLIILVLLLQYSFGQRNKEIKPLNKITTEVAEPSDICAIENNANAFFVVSDEGYLYKID